MKATCNSFQINIIWLKCSFFPLLGNPSWNFFLFTFLSTVPLCTFLDHLISPFSLIHCWLFAASNNHFKPIKHSWSFCLFRVITVDCMRDFMLHIIRIPIHSQFYRISYEKYLKKSQMDFDYSSLTFWAGLTFTSKFLSNSMIGFYFFYISPILRQKRPTSMMDLIKGFN